MSAAYVCRVHNKVADELANRAVSEGGWEGLRLAEVNYHTLTWLYLSVLSNTALLLHMSASLIIWIVEDAESIVVVR